MIMINQKEQKNQLLKEVQPAFKELKVLQHLRNAGFKKRFGFTCSYFFQIIFVLIFHHKNWFQLLESVRGEDFPGKDAVYRFLNHETFFKCTKSLLRLQKEFQGRSYDMLVSHTTIVFSRYILLAWQHRQNTDERILGGLFTALCDEVSELDWAVALQQLLELLNDVSNKVSKKITKLIKGQLQQWIAGLPSYIKAYLPDLCCES